MCRNLRLPDGHWCRTQGEMCDALGAEVVRDCLRDPVEPIYRSACLCPVSLQRLAEIKGWTIKDDPFDCLMETA